MKKRRNAVLPLLCAALMAGFLASCGEDRTWQYEELIAEDRWIKEEMDNIYLWKDDMPADEDLDFFQPAATFFQNLLSRSCQDGKGDPYSYLEDLSDDTRAISEESTYGFDFLLFQPTQTPRQAVARVTLVLEGSPAEKAGLKRGNWISQVDGEALTRDNYEEYLYNGSGMEVTLARADTAQGIALWTDTAAIRIDASQRMENNPFYADTVYHINGRRIAYLMYNAFSTGPDNAATDPAYNNQMRDIFGRFKAAGATDFILDLRYNPGGYLSCSQVLASLLAPAEAFGQPYCHLSFNDMNTSRDTTYTLREDLAEGNGLGLSRLYVITSEQTASASEAVINGLRPYMEVITIGTKTEGKNVASMPVSSPEYPSIILHPIVALITNANGESDSQGILPDHACDESEEATFATPLQPIGSTQECLLRHAINLITGTDATGEPQAAPRRRLPLEQIANSMDRRRQQAIHHR